MNSVLSVIRHVSPGLMALLLLLTPACQPELPLLEQIRQSGELVVATRVGPTTYYNELDHETGFEYELAKGFADYLGVKLRLVTFEDYRTMFQALEEGKVHCVAAGVSVSEQHSNRYRFTRPYQFVSQQLIYRRGTPKPQSLKALSGKLVVASDSSHNETLAALQAQYPDLNWEAFPNISPMRLLSLVHQGEADYTIVDSNVFAIYQEIFPELRAGFNIKSSKPLAWALQKNQDSSLYFAAELFFERINEDGTLEELQERFFGHREFDYVGARTFLRHMDSRLPRYANKFKEAAQQLELDWRLLAAIAYQESLWNPGAISPTGVRGIMMLTRRTAKEMGVKNRHNASQSIAGGSRYFKKLYDRLPNNITEPNRTWFALAAYNAGYGHLMDARTLTAMQGGDPNDWFDVKQRLPLLKKRKYYKLVKYGYARGGAQAVHYVQNVRKYYDALVWATEHRNEQYQPLPQNTVAQHAELVH